MNPSTRRRKRLVAAGVVAASLSVAGAGAAMAANAANASAVEETAASEAPTAEAVATPVPAATDPAPEPAAEPASGGITEAQSAALWDAGYTPEDIDALGVLWGTEWWETKSRLGQMLIDGVEVPVTPGSTPSQTPGVDQTRALWNAGYTYEDAAALAALWGIDPGDAKIRAGQALMDGETLPIAPGSSVTP